MAGGLSCGAQCLKYTLFIFNFLIWVFGGVILGISIWLAADPTAKERFGIASNGNNVTWDVAVYTMIAIGAIIFILAFIGCCGAWQDNTCLLLWYAILLCILLVLEITAGILAAVFHQQISDNINKNMMDQVKNRYEDDTNSDSFHTSWNKQHQQLQCCGANGPSDWVNSTFSRNNADKPVPLSCCKSTESNVVILCYNEARLCNPDNTCPTGNSLYIKGCSEGLQQWFQANVGILIGIAFGIVAIQIFAIIFACCLRSSIQQAEFVV